MRITKTFRYQLKKEEILYFKFAGSCRYIFNHELARTIEALDKGQFLTYNDYAKELTLLKRQPETEWLKEAPAQILQQALMDLDQAVNVHYKSKNKKKKIGFPRFKKRGLNDSFRYPQYVKVKDDKVYLPKIGWVTYYDSRPIEGTIASATVKREGKHWFITIVCHIEIETVAVKPVNIIGIDVGIKHAAVLSTGQVFENPHFLKTNLDKLKREQKKLSRKVKESNNYKKQAQKIGRLHIKVKNSRKDSCHKVSTAIVKNHDAFVVEDLSISGLMKNHKLAQAIADISWYMLISMIEYKARWQGKSFVKIDKYEPTSKRCSSCGLKKPMPLHERTYNCSYCGLTMDRDLNASINIRAAGHVVLARGVISIS